MLGGRSIQSPCTLGTQRPMVEEQAGCLQEAAGDWLPDLAQVPGRVAGRRPLTLSW